MIHKIISYLLVSLLICSTNILFAQITKNDLVEKGDGILFKKGESNPYSGTSIDKYSNGNIQREYNYLNGKEHGICRWFFENGKIKMEATYIEGKENGVLVLYNEKGFKEFEESYKLGIPDGAWIWFNEDGTKNQIEYFTNGEKTKNVTYYPNQQKKSEITYKNGLEDGPLFFWF